MALESVLEQAGQYARFYSAIGPFAIASVARLIAGGNRITRGLLSASVVWFTLNVLFAPYSAGMQQDLENLREWLR